MPVDGLIGTLAFLFRWLYGCFVFFGISRGKEKGCTDGSDIFDCIARPR